MTEPNIVVAPSLRVRECTPPGVDGSTRTMAVLRGVCRTLLPVVDVVVVCDDWEAPPVQGHIPFGMLVQLLDGFVSWVDDAHIVVEKLDAARWETLVREVTQPAEASAPASPAATEFATGGWVWLVDQNVRYLAFEFNDPSRGRTARGRAVSEPPTVAEVQAAVEQPDHTFPTGAGVGKVVRLDGEEIRLLGLPPAPPWA